MKSEKNEKKGRRKLTKKIVDGLPLPEKGQVFYWDENLIGFGLRLTPTRKTYIAQARVNGTTRRATVGVHGIITADQAREKALRLLGEMADGKDPGAEKRKERAEQTTLREVADRYMELKRTKKGHPLKQASKNDIDRHVKTTFSDWADLPLASITRDMVGKRYQQALKKSEAQAVQGFRVLRAIYNWQRNNTKDKSGNPTMPENPCLAITDNSAWAYVPARDRKIPLKKVGLTWNLLRATLDSPGQTDAERTMTAAVMFAFLTGARWGEVAPLIWTQVDFDESAWGLPDPKNRKKITFPLNRQALEILKGQAGKHDVFVFPGRGKAGHVHRPTRLMRKMGEACGVAVSPHDLRRTYNAIGEACGIEYWKRKLLLGHSVGGDVTLSSYSETNDLTRLAPEAQQIADWIEQQGRIAGAENVVDLETKRRAKTNG